MATHIDFDACETRATELKNELVKYLSSYEQIRSIMNDFNATFHDDTVKRVMERLAFVEKENTKLENALNCFIHDVEYAMNQLNISDGPGTKKMRCLGERGVKTLVNEEVTVYRVIPSPDGVGYSISAEFDGNVEITHYDNVGKTISRTYGIISKIPHKRFKIQICPVKEIYLISNYINLDNAAVIMCSSYPVDLSKCEAIKNKVCLEFDDITNVNSSTVFTLKKALKIKDFIDNLEDYVKALYICCDSGESRSAAISAAVMRYLKLNDEMIWANPYYHPNPLVYKLQCKAFGVFVNSFMIKKRIKMNENALRKYMNRK